MPRLLSMSKPARLRALDLLLAALLMMTVVVSAARGLEFSYDFHHFYRDAEYVWNHAALNPDLSNPDPLLRRQLPFYLPAVPLALSPLGGLGRVAAAMVWTLMQAGSLACVLILLRRRALSLLPEGAPEARRAQLAALLAWLLAVPGVYEAARFNQLSIPLLAVLLLAERALHRGRGLQAGLLFAGGAVLKLLPALFVFWLLLKRQARAGLAFLVGAIVLAVLPSLLCFGPERTWSYHREWFEYNVRGAAGGGMTDPGLREHFIDHRNQSLPAVVSRLCWPEHPHPSPIQIASLSLEQCRLVATVLALMLGAALLAATHRPLQGLGDRRAHAEFSTYLLALLALSPLVRQYYLVWALPALQLLAVVALEPGRSRARACARAGLAVWLLGMMLWVVPQARLLGAHLLMLIALGGLLLAAVPPAATSPTAHGPSAGDEPERPYGVASTRGGGSSSSGST